MKRKKILSMALVCIMMSQSTMVWADTDNTSKDLQEDSIYIEGSYDMASTIELPKSDFSYKIVDGDVVILAYKGSSSEIVIPSAIGQYPVKVIDSYAFEKTENLKKVTISEGITEIREGAFYNCINLTSVTLPSTITKIGSDRDVYGVFEYCDNLTKVVMNEGENDATIGKYAFRSIGIESLTIPSNYKTVGVRAFDNCMNLKDLTISEGVTEILEGAFYYCKGLTSVTIPSSIVGLGKSYGDCGVFEDCSELTNVTIKEGINDAFIGDYTFMYTNIDTIEIPKNYKIICDGAFSRCNNLKKAYIPSSVEEIRDNAFLNTRSVEFYGKQGSNTQTFAVNKDYKFYEYTGDLNTILTSDTANVNTGGKIIFTANSYGGIAPYTYSFLVCNPEKNEWYRYGNGKFTSSNKLTWTASGTGKRKFFVEVKDSTGKVVRSEAAIVNVGKALETGLSVKAAVSEKNPMAGNRIDIIGKPNGGNGKYTYSFLIHNPAKKEWYRYGNGKFTTNNKLSWTASGKGIRNFYVEVKDSTGKVVRSKAASVYVEGQVNPLNIIVETSRTSVSVGSAMTITGRGMGGSGNYTYSFIINNKTTGAWSTVKKFSPSNTYTWTAGSIGERSFYVEIKDSTGKVVRSEAVDVSTK